MHSIFCTQTAEIQPGTRARESIPCNPGFCCGGNWGRVKQPRWADYGSQILPHEVLINEALCLGPSITPTFLETRPSLLDILRSSCKVSALHRQGKIPSCLKEPNDGGGSLCCDVEAACSAAATCIRHHLEGRCPLHGLRGYADLELFMDYKTQPT